MPQQPTADLELTIAPLGEAHELRMRLTRPGDASLRLSDPYPVVIDRELLRVKESEGMDTYSDALRDMLFSAPAAAEFTRLRAAARGSGAQIRVHLVLPDSLHSLRWEVLPDPASGRALARDGGLLLSRYLSGDDDEPITLRPKGQLRALIAVAAPSDATAHGLAPIDAAAEMAAVIAALDTSDPGVSPLSRARERGTGGEDQIAVTTIAATWDALSAALREGCDILYLVAHGVLNGDKPWLYLVDEGGNANKRRGGALADLLFGLGAERRPRLVVLASCESAGDGYADAIAALGPLLARAGVPAVLAMQGRFGIATNATFAPVLFGELRRDGLIDRAVNMARLAVEAHADWWMPVLYTRLKDGLIWREEPGEPGAAYATLHQLRAPVADFVGRDEEIAELLAALRGGGGATISGVAGMGGIGKTELAMQVANALLGDYPDAQIVLNLQGSREPALSPAQALQQVIRAFLPDAQLPDDEQSLVGAYRSVLSGKHALILADDARDAAQVKRLIPPPGSALLITSRQRFTLGGMRRIDLEQLGEESAVALLRGICDRLADAEARQIAAACGRLPLALRIAGGVLANDETLSVARYLARLADEKRRLAALRDPDDPDLDVRASIALSYDLLSAEMQAILRTLGVFAASFDLAAAGAVLGEADPNVLADRLGALYRRSLVEFANERYDLHELVRVFALGKLGDDERAARLLHVKYYIAIAEKADQLYIAGDESVLLGLALFDQERPNLDAARLWLHSVASDAEADSLLIADASGSARIGYLRYSTQHEIIPQLKIALGAAKRLGLLIMQGAFLGNLGLAYAALGNARKAIECHEQNLLIAHATGDRSSEAKAFGNLGSAYSALGEARQAIEFHEQHLAIARELGDRRSEGHALSSLGISFTDLGNPGQAIEFHKQYLVIARELGDYHGEGVALGNIGIAYSDLGHPRQAIDYYQQHIALARKVGDRRGEASALGNLGSAYADMGDINTAIKLYQQHLDLSREQGDRRSEAVALGNLGGAHTDLRKFEEAIYYHQQQLAITREIGDRRVEANALGNLGVTYADMGDIDRAIDLQQQRLAISYEIGDHRSKASALGNLGRAYADLGDFHQAMYYQQQRLLISREIGDRRGESEALGNLGSVCLGLEAFDQAILFNQEYLAICREIQNRRGEGSALGNLGTSFANIGSPDTAVKYYLEGLAIVRELGDRQGEGAFLGNLGLAYYDLGDVKKAIEYLQQHLVIAIEVRDQRGEAETSWNLGRVLVIKGDPLQAIPYLEKGFAFHHAIKHPRSRMMAKTISHVRKHGQLLPRN